MTAHFHPDDRFRSLLHADAPHPALAEKLSLYGRLVGGWEMDVIRHAADGIARSEGEIHFGWILGGRAIQDIWIAPRPALGPPKMFGTTLRLYDPDIDAWHIFWNDPVKQAHSRQIGRAEGDDIVQDGTDAAGEHVRWRFTDIKPGSFHWIGARSSDDGQTWRIEVEFLARRTSA